MQPMICGQTPADVLVKVVVKDVLEVARVETVETMEPEANVVVVFFVLLCRFIFLWCFLRGCLTFRVVFPLVVEMD